MKRVNEKTTHIVTATFKDENGTLQTPTSATVKIDDVTSGTVIRAEGALTVTSSSADITITSAENSLQNQNNAVEIRRVTVTADYGTGKKATSEYLYQLVNLGGLS